MRVFWFLTFVINVFFFLLSINSHEVYLLMNPAKSDDDKEKENRCGVGVNYLCW